MSVIPEERMPVIPEERMPIIPEERIDLVESSNPRRVSGETRNRSEITLPRDASSPQPNGRASEPLTQRQEPRLEATSVDELFRTILDRIERQDSQTNERINAIIAAQEASQAQLERLQATNRYVVEPQSDDEANLRQRNLDDEIDTRRRRRTSSIAIGSRHDEHARQRASRSRSPRVRRRSDSGAAPESGEQELERLASTVKDMTTRMHRATGSAPDIEKVLEETQRSPFTSRISGVRIRHISKLKFRNYDGLEDPRPFMTAVSIAINRAHFSKAELEAGSCQLFVEHLSGAALTWFSRLEPNSIGSYHQLTMAFLKNYGVHMRKERSNADLWTLAQTQKESLRDFIGRFREVVTNVNTPDAVSIAALRNALWHESKFKEDLMINEPETLLDALHRANRFVEIEEEKALRAKLHAPSKISAPKEKSKEEHHEPRQHYDAEYSQNFKGSKNSTFHIDNPEMPTEKRWSKWQRGTDSRTDAKAEPVYCEFHKNYSHSTESCRELQSQLLARFKRGNLDLEREQAPRGRDQRARYDGRNRRDDRRAQSVERRDRANSAPRQLNEAPNPVRRIN